ncbi:hypothetical protein [Pseudonocardia alni]|uniref:hypothetical protein n=1 Tax=Pseudonocardia alni TaxID=33907 RepID=UPI0033C04C49
MAAWNDDRVHTVAVDQVSGRETGPVCSKDRASAEAYVQWVQANHPELVRRWRHRPCDCGGSR